MHFIYLTGIVRLTETIWIWIIIMNLSGRYSTCEETGTRSRIAQSSILCTSKHVEANTRITVVCSANCKYTLIFWLSTLQRMTILGLAQSIWFYYKRGNRFFFFLVQEGCKPVSSAPKMSCSPRGPAYGCWPVVEATSIQSLIGPLSAPTVLPVMSR